MAKKIIRTAFEKDSNGANGELFLLVRDFIKVAIGNGVKEKFRENVTSYFTKEGGYCSIKAYDEFIQIGWFQGNRIDDRYDLLTGNGKKLRSLKIYTLERKSRETIKYYADQTMLILIEQNELKKIKNSFTK